MTMSIRPARPDDYEALALVHRLSMPGTDDSGESLLDEDEHTSAHQRWAAEVDGRVVGSASWFQLPSRLHPQKFWMDGAVHPDFQRRGIGAALFEEILVAITPQDPLSLRTFARADYAGTLRFLERRGFVEAKRTWESFLDLSSFSFGPYAGQPEALEAQGIQLRSLADLQREVPDWQERLLDLYNAIQTDVPDIDSAAVVPLDDFRSNYLKLAWFLSEGHLIALDGDRWVGMSSLGKANDADLLSNGITGVLPAYRRRGIALALKLRGLAWARLQGISRIRTTNASTNVGMLSINERLGFVKAPAWVHLLREF